MCTFDTLKFTLGIILNISKIKTFFSGLIFSLLFKKHILHILLVKGN